MTAVTGPAAVLERVASLVAAGIAPRRAWALAAGEGGTDRSAGAVWHDVAAVIAVAEWTGAPVEPTLRALARAVRESTESDRAVRVALAGPRTSARVVLALPLLGLLLGSLWGAGAVHALVATPIGWVCASVAAVLVLIARRWSSRLVAAATPPDHVAGALLEAWAVAVSGGGSWRSAGRAVARAWPDQRGRAEEHRRAREALELASAVGVPVAGLLRAAAEDVRRDSAAAGLAEAERLGVRLVLPLGVCILPAFVLVGVVPVLVGVLSATAGTVG